jgi:hypothetical protein
MRARGLRQAALYASDTLAPVWERAIELQVAQSLLTV